MTLGGVLILAFHLPPAGAWGFCAMGFRRVRHLAS